MEMDLSWSILDGKKRFFQAFSPACDVRDFWQHDEHRCYATVKSTFSGLLLCFRTCRQMPYYLYLMEPELMMGEARGSVHSNIAEKWELLLGILLHMSK